MERTSVQNRVRTRAASGAENSEKQGCVPDSTPAVSSSETMSIRYCRQILCVVMLFVQPLFASGPEPGMRQLIHHRWQEISHVNFGSVHAVMQSRDGYLWIMTESGAARFDGRSFRMFSSKNTPEMRTGTSKAVVESDDGCVWVGTLDGLMRFDGERWTRIGMAAGLPDKWVDDLAVDRDGNIVAGTRKGLVRVKPDGSILEVEELDGARVFDLHVDASGRLWVATEAGLCIFDGMRCEPVRCESETGVVKRIEPHRGQDVFLITETGVFQSDGSRTIPVLMNSALPVDAVVLSVCESRDGALWLGTTRHGLFCSRDNHLASFDESDGLTHNRVQCILEDREGSIWVGTGQGLDRFHRSVFQSYTQSDGLPYRMILSVVADDTGNFWVATQKGVARWDAKGACTTWMNGEQVNALFPVGSGRVWAGAGKLTALPMGNRSERRIFNEVGNADPLCFAEDHSGTRWIGTVNGLFAVTDDETVVRYTMAAGLPSNDIRDIQPLPDGTVWVGTNDGIAVIQDDVVGTFGIQNGLPGTFIFEIFRDRAGQIWVGTDVGLSLFKDGRFLPLTVHNGLPSSDMYGIQEDETGTFWVNHGSGVLSVKRSELIRCAGTDEVLVLRTYTKEDGLPVNSGLGGTQPVTWQTDDGRFWFATGGGLAAVDPVQIQRNEVAPPVVMEDVRVDGKPVSKKQQIVLEPGWKRLSLDYAGLSFLVPERVRYRIMLTGYDEGWIETTERSISYTNLSPGNYTFQVYACNNDGVWSTEPAELRVRVVTPWWRTWWFITIAILLLGVLMSMLLKGVRGMWNMFVQWRRTHVFGSYRILEQVGKGGMGTVYRASDGRDGSLVALKVLDADAMDEDGRKRFEREGIIGERVNHPNVVRIHDRGAQRGTMFYAMEFCDGTPLRELMEIGLGIRTSVAMTLVLVDILADLHRQGIVHRDIKPENIMVLHSLNILDVEHAADPVETLRPHVKLLDFGVARMYGASTLTRTGLVTGTLQYVPPEALNGTRYAEPDMDYYAIGVMLYEMITGIQPFEGEEPGRVMYAILYRSLVPPVDVVPHLPEQLSGLVIRMTEKEPGIRLQEPALIRSELMEILERLVRGA